MQGNFLVLDIVVPVEAVWLEVEFGEGIIDCVGDVLL